MARAACVGATHPCWPHPLMQPPNTLQPDHCRRPLASAAHAAPTWVGAEDGGNDGLRQPEGPSQRRAAADAQPQQAGADGARLPHVALAQLLANRQSGEQGESSELRLLVGGASMLFCKAKSDEGPCLPAALPARRPACPPPCLPGCSPELQRTCTATRLCPAIATESTMREESSQSWVTTWCAAMGTTPSLQAEEEEGEALSQMRVDASAGRAAAATLNTRVAEGEAHCACQPGMRTPQVPARPHRAAVAEASVLVPSSSPVRISMAPPALRKGTISSTAAPSRSPSTSRGESPPSASRRCQRHAR